MRTVGDDGNSDLLLGLAILKDQAAFLRDVVLPSKRNAIARLQKPKQDGTHMRSADEAASEDAI